MAALDDTYRGAGGFGSTGTKQLTQSSQAKDKKGTKKKNPLSPSLGSRLRQAQNSVRMVVSAGPGPSSTSWFARGSTDEQEVVSPNSVPGGDDYRGRRIHDDEVWIPQVELQSGELLS